MPSLLSPQLAPILMLVASNVFMTFAWYGHLKYRSTPLLIAIVVSWGIAFVEYCLAVPANRIGAAHYSTAELKTMQEVITLLVFVGFSWLYLREPLGWNHILGFALIALGFLLYREPLLGIPVFQVGEWLLAAAAILTLWSGYEYARAAWPALRAEEAKTVDRS